MSLHFAHIVNPYGVKDELDRVQKLTLSMLLRAANQCGQHVELLTAQTANDRKLIPGGFTPTYDLEFTNDQVANLPLLRDILERACETSSAEFIIYSNMDIIPVPEFYDGISALIRKHQCDALIVNRRRVDASLINDPELLLHETGLPHPGYDCFVFRRDLFQRLSLGKILLGAPGVGFMFAHNLFLFAAKCVVVSDKHLTLHAGYEIVQEWKGQTAAAHQMREIKKFLRDNAKYFSIDKFPGYNYPFFRRHFRWLMNPLFHYPLMFRLDMKKLFDGRKIVPKARRDSWWQEWKASRINFD